MVASRNMPAPLRFMNQAVRAIYTPDSTDERRQSITLLIRIVVLVGAYFAFEFWVRRAAVLSFAAYAQAILVTELLRQMISGIIPLIGIGLLLISGIIGRKALFSAWDTFDHGKPLRLLIGIMAFVTTWIYSTYSWNLYFDQGHIVERLLLIVLLLLVWWRPVFVLPHCILLVCIMGQFNYPVTEQSALLVSFNLLAHTLQLFSVFFIVHLLTGTRRTADFIFVLCCLIGASYFRPGLGKLQMDWLSHPHLYFLLTGGYSNGWLDFLQAEQVTALVQLIRPFTVPMMLFTLVVELGSLVFMAHRRLLLLYLPLCIAFHTGVVLMCGIFFWHWMVLEVALLIFLYRTRSQPLQFHTWAHILLAVVLIAGGSYWFRSTLLAWYDTPLYYRYQYEAVTSSGQKIMLDNRLFAPYGDLFRFENLSFLTSDTQLTATYGVTGDSRLAEALVNARTADDVFALENEFPAENYNSVHVDEFRSLIATFIQNWNRYEGRNPAWWNIAQPPGELLGFPRHGESAVWTEPIEQVNVYQVTSFFDGEIYSDIRQRIVLEVLIPPST